MLVRPLPSLGAPLMCALLALAGCDPQENDHSVSSEAPARGSSLVDLAFPAAHASDLLDQPDRIADVAEAVLPAVVNISSTRFARRSSVDPREDMLREFFGMPDEPRGGRPQQGQGSGVVVSGEGLILTNNHVVENADEVSVTFSDGHSVMAEVLGADPATDLAVLQILETSSQLPHLALGDPDTLRLGQIVLAIGNPFGLAGSVTMGIVSAKGRGNVGITDYEDFIQTDAAINPGNSGGALVNLDGELVGINTAILSRTGGYQGIGFAVPADMAAQVMDDLIDHGRVVRGWLGVSIQTVDEDIAAAFEMPGIKGVLISDVLPGSPAEGAGLSRGDIVTAVDTDEVETSAQLRNVVSLKGADQSVTLQVLRDGKSKRLTVTLGELPGESDAPAPGAQPDATDGILDGVQLAPIDSPNAERLGVPKGLRQGTLVVKVDPSSRAGRAGLRTGDILLELNRQVIRRPADARLPEGQRGLFLVQRGEATSYIVIPG